MRWAIGGPYDPDVTGTGGDGWDEANDVAAGAFEVAVTGNDGVCCVGVVGELDLITGAELIAVIETLAGDAGDDVLLDLSAVPFIDSEGLRALLLATERVSSRSRRLVLGKASAAVERLLQLAGIDEHVIART